MMNLGFQDDMFHPTNPDCESEEFARSCNYFVMPVNRSDCDRFILGIHYAKRWPSASFMFGLFRRGRLVGVCTFGTPPSSPLRKSLGDNCLELNRLCLADNIKNEASILVSKSLKMIPRGITVVSFADTDQSHVGWVYQATNFIYYGLSEKRTDWKVKGMEHRHGITIADQFRGSSNRAEAIRAYYGDDFYLKDRPRKHRYLYFTGSKRQRKSLQSAVPYKLESYPKS